MRWMSLGAAEIADADAGDDAGELGPRAAFALDFEAARAEYLLGLARSWQAAIKRRDSNTAKVIAGMLSSQSPDEYSERRVVRSVDQRTQVSGDVTISRFASMSTEDLAIERSKIAARLDAAQALGADDSWRAAAVRLPRQVLEEDIDPATPLDENPTLEKFQSGSRTRKLGGGALPLDDPGLSQENISTRARVPGASVADGPSVLVPDVSAPDHASEGGVPPPGASPSLALPPELDPAKFLAADDEETKL